MFRETTKTMVWSEELEKIINLREQLEMSMAEGCLGGKGGIENEGLLTWLIEEDMETYLNGNEEEFEDYIPVYINEMIRHENWAEWREHMRVYHNVKFRIY